VDSDLKESVGCFADLIMRVKYNFYKGSGHVQLGDHNGIKWENKGVYIHIFMCIYIFICV
jgi:hypothetical protein